MTETKTTTHPQDIELAEYLSNSLSADDRARVDEHLASCDACLEKVVAAYDSVKNRKAGFMKKINLYLILAIISFAVSFIYPQYFLQLLVATIILGMKWIVDSKTTKMLIMIHEAWKKGGEREASRILSRLEK